MSNLKEEYYVLRTIKGRTYKMSSKRPACPKLYTRNMAQRWCKWFNEHGAHPKGDHWEIVPVMLTFGPAISL